MVLVNPVSHENDVSHRHPPIKHMQTVTTDLQQPVEQGNNAQGRSLRPHGKRLCHRTLIRPALLVFSLAEPILMLVQVSRSAMVVWIKHVVRVVADLIAFFRRGFAATLIKNTDQCKLLWTLAGVQNTAYTGQCKDHCRLVTLVRYTDQCKRSSGTLTDVQHSPITLVSVSLQGLSQNTIQDLTGFWLHARCELVALVSPPAI